MKIIPLPQPLPKAMHLLIGLDCLEFLLSVAKIHATEISLALGVALVLSFELIDAFFLPLEFGVIQEILTFCIDGCWLGVLHVR